MPPAALDEIIVPLPERHVLLAQLLIELARVLDRFAVGGFAALRPQWQARHAWRDRPVCLLRDGQVEKGRASAVAPMATAPCWCRRRPVSNAACPVTFRCARYDDRHRRRQYPDQVGRQHGHCVDCARRLADSEAARLAEVSLAWPAAQFIALQRRR